MIEKSLAQPAPQPTPDYVWRGRGLFETHRDEVLTGYQGGGRWLVPSGTETGKLYEVRVGTRPERNKCECTGFQRHGHCSHVVCAGLARKKSATCDGCGARSWWSNLTEVQEDHESLTWSPGDRLCGGCVRDHGGIS